MIARPATLGLLLAISAAGAQAPAVARRETSSAGFKTPVAVRHDPGQDVYFVSNVNGVGDAHDNNGFIAKLRPDGFAISMRWIAGGRSGVRLDAPKGMLLRGDTLWVTDIDTLRAFERTSGRPLRAIGVRGALFLNGLAEGPDGALYITDTGLRFQRDGSPAHPGPDRVYRVDRTGAVDVALTSPRLSAPTGITWSAARGEFVIVSLNGTAVLGWKPGERAPRPIASGAGDFDGAFALSDGRVLVSSQTGTVRVLLSDALAAPLVTGLETPADVGVDERRRRLLVPLLLADRVEVWSVPGLHKR